MAGANCSKKFVSGSASTSSMLWRGKSETERDKKRQHLGISHGDVVGVEVNRLDATFHSHAVDSTAQCLDAMDGTEKCEMS